jgi:hypothetical protein
LDIFAFLFHRQSFMRSPKTKLSMWNEEEQARPSRDLPGHMSQHALRPNNSPYAVLSKFGPEAVGDISLSIPDLQMLCHRRLNLRICQLIESNPKTYCMTPANAHKTTQFN